MSATGKIVCSRPFEWFEVHPDGSVFLCCPAWLKRKAGNLLHQSVEEIWNGPVAQEIRKSIHNGSFHNCNKKRCPHLLNQTSPVSPLGQIKNQPLHKTLADKASALSYLPTQLNLCFDHSCNLACSSCRSSVTQARGKALQQAERISTILLRELIPAAEIITLSGFGDPFGSPTYLELLRQLERGDYPQLQQLRLHTNGQLFTEQMWLSLPKLQRLISEIEISLDAATANTYAKNRPGGDFNRLLKNLDFLSGQSAQLTLSMVVQKNNWRELDLFVELAQRFDAKIYLSQLVNWGTFSRPEFRQRAVYLADHPDHAALLAKLQSLSLTEAVELGNLQHLLA